MIVALDYFKRIQALIQRTTIVKIKQCTFVATKFFRIFNSLKKIDVKFIFKKIQHTFFELFLFLNINPY